ncbi:MAG: single-stranded-DNA-specific exonuclease RecJ [Alphaproteobacteria bacterium]|nr:single-stranded-DNA-specific exonuclease RecJ [Alphaproteobacteria bacterium]
MIQSLTGNLWHVRYKDFLTKENVCEILLKNRGFDQDFLDAKLKNTMPDPYVFKDMEKAVERIVKAMFEKQPIAILGDYDVDGVSSTSIFVKFFQTFLAKYEYCIPDRMEDGYGLNINNIKKYKNHLIIAVDCGSNSHEELEYAKNHGIEVIVIDHHKMTSIPSAVAVVNPHRPDEKDDFKYLCATALVFMCIIGIRRKLQGTSYKENRRTPDIRSYLDLVAIATICDVMPLISLNRAFVKFGLQILKQKSNLGINALMTLGEKTEINEETIGFFIGPHLNAAGRVGSADISVKLLTSSNVEESQNLALELLRLNKFRQSVETLICDEAEKDIGSQDSCICVFNPNWHLGVIGIVAGRLKEKYNKPSIVISCDAHKMGKASCRSVPGVDISAIIRKGIESGIIDSGGGHLLAAGFSIPTENISQLKQFLQQEISIQESVRVFETEGFIDGRACNIDFVNTFSALSPFGEGNKLPTFVLSNVTVSNVRVLKAQHICATLNLENNITVKGLAFRSAGTCLGDILLSCPNKCSLLVAMTISCWQNKQTLNFLIKDVAEMKHL